MSEKPGRCPILVNVKGRAEPCQLVEGHCGPCDPHLYGMAYESTSSPNVDPLPAHGIARCQILGPRGWGCSLPAGHAGGVCWFSDSLVRSPAQVRAEVVQLAERARQLSREVLDLFTTEAWISPETELPPDGLEVLCIVAGCVAFCTRDDRHGNERDIWKYRGVRNDYESKSAPEFWHSIPPEPK